MGDLNSLFGDLDSISKSHEPQWCTDKKQREWVQELMSAAKTSLERAISNWQEDPYVCETSDFQTRCGFGATHFIKSSEFHNIDKVTQLTNITVVDLSGDIVELCSNKDDVFWYFINLSPGLLYSYDREYYYMLKENAKYDCRRERTVYYWTIIKRKNKSEPYWRFEDLW